jgi:hydrogenase-4 component F
VNGEKSCATGKGGAVTGSPPFGLFLSEFAILTGAIRGGHPWVAAAMLLLLAVIFIGMANVILEVAYGKADPALPKTRESGWLIGSPLVLAAAVLLLGLYIPAGLHEVLARAATSLGGGVP